MSASLLRRLADAVPSLADRVEVAAAPLIEHRGADEALQTIEGPALVGLARAIATHAETAGFLSHRPALVERIARADGEALAHADADLEGWKFDDIEDLEGSLDALRLLRREEMVLAGCLQHSGQSSFDEVSRFLSNLAETITRHALDLALAHVRVREAPSFAVIGMGKIAGREFTYHSDLDLIFLTEGGAEEVDAASRIGQRLITYLTTMTGAGSAYAVDTRLRPSGGQGTLVTTLPAFERYQTERAETWEHLAMLRARAIAGATEKAQNTLDRVRDSVLRNHSSPWDELLPLRKRVEQERGGADKDAVAYKTGPGGLMDVDFLAGGGLLERGERGCPELPSVPTMLRHAAAGERVEGLLDHYGFLRRVEAAARWMSGRGVESLAANPDTLEAAALLIDPSVDGAGIREKLVATLSQIRNTYERVADAGSIAGLES